MKSINPNISPAPAKPAKVQKYEMPAEFAKIAHTLKTIISNFCKIDNIYNN